LQTGKKSLAGITTVEVFLQFVAQGRAAKLQTRCGMGSCQGRVCGPATQFIFKWDPDSVRPPIFPARVEALAIAVSGPEPDFPEPKA
jgi:hypothetical protein